MHYRFHVNIFAHPAGAIDGPPVDLHGITLQTLRGADGRSLTFDAFLPVTFEQTIDALLKIPRLDAEPDGFFVLAGGQGPTHWRVSGHLYDFNGRLHRMELNGACPVESFDAMLACLGWPHTPLAFELVEQGVTLHEPAFRTWASRAVPGPGA